MSDKTVPGLNLTKRELAAYFAILKKRHKIERQLSTLRFLVKTTEAENLRSQKKLADAFRGITCRLFEIEDSLAKVLKKTP